MFYAPMPRHILLITLLATDTRVLLRRLPSLPEISDVVSMPMAMPRHIIDYFFLRDAVTPPTLFKNYAIYFAPMPLIAAVILRATPPTDDAYARVRYAADMLRYMRAEVAIQRTMFLYVAAAAPRGAARGRQRIHHDTRQLTLYCLPSH